MDQFFSFLWILPLLFVIPVTIAAGSNCDIPQTELFIQDIPEDWPVGTVLRHLNIHGDDNDIRIYETISEPHVSFDPVSRNLTLVQPLDAESPTGNNLQLSLRLTCEIRATAQTVNIDIVILLLDVNDNAPIFLQNEYSVSVNELTPVGTTLISSISATDADLDNNYVSYIIEEGPYASYFDIPSPAKGVITLKQSLDFEENNQISITVVAQDNHGMVLNQPQPSLNSTATLLITVLDGDDRNPEFVQAPYFARVEENFPVGSLVEVTPGIFARDGDYNISAPIAYSIVHEDTAITDDSAYFSIESDTGLLALAHSGLQRNRVLTLEIKATQEDNADRFNKALLRVLVVASNSNPPYFSRSVYTASLVENVPVGTPVLQVSASDNDEGSQLSFELSDPLVTTFYIDNVSGEVKTAELLDYEVNRHYNITIQVTDGVYINTATLSVTVLDVNDNSPQFDQNSYEFRATRETGYILGQVIAFDEDFSSTLSYSLLEDTSLFSISNSGELAVVGELEDLTEPAYKLVVVARDNGNPPLQGTAVVNVIFDEPETGGATVGTEQQEVDLVLIIILGVMCGILLVIIIILLVYIYRKKRNLLTDKEHRMRAQTFEQRRFSMQQQTQESQQRSYIDDPKMTQYKQNAAHHLALYNNIHTTDSTQPQENPFVPDDSYDANYLEEGVDFNRNKSVNHDAVSVAPTVQQHDTLRRHMPYVHEIEYESAVAPIDQVTDDSSTDSLQSSSVPSVAESAHTFRAGGSTQNLVTPKGTIKSRKSAVSFIEGVDNDFVGSQSSGRDPRMSVKVPEEKPGITVYY